MRKLFPLFLLIVGIVLTYHGFQSVCDARESARWPRVPGEVMESSIIESRKVGFPKENLRRIQYRPGVVYQYEVEGKQYQSDAIAFGEGPTNTKPPAREIQSRYPVGKAVSVFYKPVDPGTSVLEPGMNPQAWMIPGIGIAFLVFGMIALLGSLKANR